jgi:putative SOS response-associated peptidase YedK
MPRGCAASSRVAYVIIVAERSTPTTREAPWRFIARVETLTQRPAFRSLLAAHRCLVPASGYYEWQGEGREKTPRYIHPQSQPFVAFAGVYDTWTKPDGEDLYTFTIITTEGDPFMERLHNRMPVILSRELEDAWLDTELAKAQDVLSGSS